MPMIRVQTSMPITSEQQSGLMRRLSETVAGALGKPESYMMVVLEPETPMLMGAKAEPAALVEVRSVGTVSAEQARKLSGAITAVLTETIGLDADRIYANFMGVPGAMWGFGERTFG